MSASVASGIAAPMAVPAAVFSAMVRVAVSGSNTGALLEDSIAEPLIAMRMDLPDELPFHRMELEEKN